MCGGVRGRARQRARSAERGGAVSAAQNPQRPPGWAARRWVGRAASSPAGSPLAACRPPSVREAARSRGAAPEPEGERPTEPTPGRTRGIRAPHSPPPRTPAAAPLRLRRCRPRSASDSSGGTRAAPGSPGEWPRALPGSSWAPPPAFAFAAAARCGLPGQRPGQPGRPRRGRRDCGEKWGRSQEATPAPRAGWEQVARGGPGALCRGAETGSGWPRLPRPLPFLPCSPGRPYAGSAG